jgi:hypothetical protein
VLASDSQGYNISVQVVMKECRRDCGGYANFTEFEDPMTSACTSRAVIGGGNSATRTTPESRPDIELFSDVGSTRRLDRPCLPHQQRLTTGQPISRVSTPGRIPAEDKVEQRGRRPKLKRRREKTVVGCRLVRYHVPFDRPLGPP